VFLIINLKNGHQSNVSNDLKKSNIVAIYMYKYILQLNTIKLNKIIILYYI